MNEQKKIVWRAYGKLAIVFGANMMILCGMIMEFLNAMATNNIMIFGMFLYIVAFGLLLIPVAVSFLSMIICFFNGMKTLQQEDYKAAIKNGKWCAGWCIVPLLFAIFAVFSVGYFDHVLSIILVCASVALIIYDIVVICLFKRISCCQKVYEMKAEEDELVVETDAHEISTCETNMYETDTFETGAYEIRANETNTYETDLCVKKKCETEPLNEMNGLAQRAYKYLEIIVRGSGVLFAVVVIAGLFYDMYNDLQLSFYEAFTSLLAITGVVGMFIGGAEICMIIFYRKGLKWLKADNFHKAGLFGVWSCVISLYIYIFLFFVAEVLLEFEGYSLLAVRGSYVLVLVYQIYAISLFVKLRRYEKANGIIEKSNW